MKRYDVMHSEVAHIPFEVRTGPNQPHYQFSKYSIRYSLAIPICKVLLEKISILKCVLAATFMSSATTGRVTVVLRLL